MGQFFKDKVEEGIRLVWMTYDKEAMYKGFNLLQEAADEGDADGYCFLARCYMGGQYVWDGARLPEDDAKAAEYVKESILRGSAIGVLCGMRCGALTPGARKKMPFSNLKEAFDIVLKKAEAGHAFCQMAIAHAYYWGDLIDIMSEIEGVKEVMESFPTEDAYDVWAYPIAIDWYTKAFSKGYGFGFNNFKKIYEKGKGGIAPNPFMVERWMKIFADGGDVLQQINYGFELQKRGDNKLAFHYYQLAANAGDACALYNLGCCYLSGRGIKEDSSMALRCFQQGADLGDEDCMYHVGYAYYEGVNGVEEDNAKAVYWLSRAAQKDCFSAYPQLAMCYQQGWGVEKDHDAAFRLFRQAETHIDSYSNIFKRYVWNGLGNAFAFGNGAPRDIALGVAYYDKAIALGDTFAAQNKAHFKKTIFSKWKQIK